MGWSMTNPFLHSFFEDNAAVGNYHFRKTVRRVIIRQMQGIEKEGEEFTQRK